MPVNFNLLRQAGPANFAEGLMQGQEDARRNALAQQQAAQQQQMNALAMRKSELGIKSLEDEQVNTRRTQKAGMFRERLLRAPTPEAARQLVVAQYNDPDLAPVLSQAGTLEQALAEVSDDPVKFEQYKQQEAMGMAEWMKSQMPKVAGNAVYLPAENRFITPPREPAPVAPSAPVAVMGADGRPQYVSREQAIGMTPFTPATVKFIGGAAAPAAPAAAGMGKPPTGYRFTPSGDLEPIPGGPATKPSQEKPASVSEQNSAYNINRVLNAATEIKDIVAKDPSALAPGSVEASAKSMGMEGAANVARSSNRQIVYGAQRDALDALLYLATGAAYNKEQLQGAWDAYMPAYTDDKPTREAKQTRLNKLLETAKVRAGKAWTPEMDTAMKSLSGTPTAAAPAKSSLTGQDKQALDWANANPNDPRAAKIKAQLGVQ